MQKKHRSTTVLEEILLELHYHLPRLAWQIQEHILLVRKESGLTLCYISHLVLFIQIKK